MNLRESNSVIDLVSNIVQAVNSNVRAKWCNAASIDFIISYIDQCRSEALPKWRDLPKNVIENYGSRLHKVALQITLRQNDEPVLTQSVCCRGHVFSMNSQCGVTMRQAEQGVGVKYVDFST